MVKFDFELQGMDKAKSDFLAFARTSDPSINSFFSSVSNAAINLLKSNTPVDTGKLKSSWRVVSNLRSKGTGEILIGVTEDQEEKLRFVSFGTRFTDPNPFVEHSEIVIQSFVNEFLAQSLDNQHRWWRESGLTGNLKRANIAKIPGASTGTKYSSRRGTGSAALKRPNKGFKSLNRRVGLRSRRISAPR